MRVTNAIPLGCSLILPVGAVNSVQSPEGGDVDELSDQDQDIQQITEMAVCGHRFCALSLKPPN
jgi:hypothetical protein